MTRETILTLLILALVTISAVAHIERAGYCALRN